MLLRYLEELSECSTVEAVWAHHVAAMQSYGFDRVFYGLTRFRFGRYLGETDEMVILTNHDPEFVAAFVDGGLYRYAPMVNWATENVGAASWSILEGRDDDWSPEEREVLALNRRYGIVAGYTISFKDVSSRAKGAIGLVGRSGLTQSDIDRIWDEHGRVLLQMNNVAHLKIASLPLPTSQRRLTDRQREVLEWVGQGKTVANIAVIMGLTPATIEKHLRLARDALGVETTAQAVLKASDSNQIFLLEP